jgi:hypothetical protein
MSAIRRGHVSVLSALASASIALAFATDAHAADPTTADCLGASEASVKLRTEHKLREARAQLLTCAAASCPADIRAECTRRVEVVNAAIPTIVFEAKNPSGDDLVAVKVTMDGRPLVERLEGTAISLDPGEHKFVFEVAGQPPLAKTLVLREGEKDRRERIVIGVATAGTVVTAPASTSSAPNTPPPEGDAGNAATLPEDHSTRRVVGFAVIGLGVASGVVAVLEQLTAGSRDQKSKDAAASTDVNVQATAGALHDQATQAQTYALIFGGVALAALGTGVVLVLTSGSSSAAPAKATTTSPVWVRPMIGTQGGGLQVGGAW